MSAIPEPSTILPPQGPPVRADQRLHQALGLSAIDRL